MIVHIGADFQRLDDLTCDQLELRMIILAAFAILLVVVDSLVMVDSGLRLDLVEVFLCFLLENQRLFRFYRIKELGHTIFHELDLPLQCQLNALCLLGFHLSPMRDGCQLLVRQFKRRLPHIRHFDLVLQLSDQDVFLLDHLIFAHDLLPLEEDLAFAHLCELLGE